jgi:uncharacterized membrane protein YkvA (DUF1232 family)
MNKSNETLNRQKLKPIEQVKIILRTKHYSIRKEKGISREVYMPIINCNCYFISVDKPVLYHKIKNVLDKADDLKKKFEAKGPLGRFLVDFKLLISILQDYWNGNYRKIPFFSIAAIVAALLYVINPFDIIPDFIPIVGLLDDAAVIAVCLAMVEQDLHNYKDWKINNSKQ